MRKSVRMTFLCVLLAALLFCGCSAADRLTFNTFHGTLAIPSSYIILTETNLSSHPEWIENHATTVEQIEDNWKANNIITQAWSSSDDVCIEITAVADDRALQYYNISAQTSDNRKIYRLSHTDGTYYAGTGYTYSDAEWKNFADAGRWLELKYSYSGTESHTGYQYRTIRNGYTITVDYKVLGRSTKKADLSALRSIMGDFKFTEIVAKPSTYISRCIFTAEPPQETATGSFSVSGTTDAGVTVNAVAMRMSSAQTIVKQETTGKTGKFDLSFELPSEGTWLVTLTTEKDGQTGEEKVFDITTYQKGLLTVNMTSVIPEEVTSDTLTITGKTMRATTVQCIVSGAGSYDKSLKVNAKQAFSFKVPTYNDGEYTITLVFQKKGYNSRRIVYTTKRSVSENDIKERYRENAVKPAYEVLVEKIKGYTGKVLTYSMYCTSVTRSGDDYVVIMAMKQKKSGAYTQLVAVTCTEDPKMVVGRKYKIYGTCRGTYKLQDQDKYYPCIELLWTE